MKNDFRELRPETKRSHHEVAKLTGLSYRQVRETEKRALAKMRRLLELRGISPLDYPDRAVWSVWDEI